MTLSNMPPETIRDAERHLDAGRLMAAEEIANRYLKRNAREPVALRILALAAAARHDSKRAIDTLKRCIALAPSEPTYYRDLANLYLFGARFDECLEMYDRALKLEPGHIETIIAKADAFEKAGRYAEARALLEPYAEQGTMTSSMAIVLARVAQRMEEYERGVEIVLRHGDLPHPNARHRGQLWEIAGHCYEKLGNYEKAFEAFSNANAVMAQPFDRDAYLARVNNILAVFTRENLQRVPKARDRSELPVFIVAMPRSGSTLVEQIIHAHPEAYGAGEIANLPRLIGPLQETIGSFQPYPECIADLTQAHVDKLAASYLGDLRRMAPGKKRVVDKQLDSIQMLGMISLLFPGGRAIYVEREPLDNCFSIFMANLDASKIRYSTDLANIGFVQRQFKRLWEHWCEQLDYRMLHINYEALVADPDAGIRRIIDFCGLKWHDQCLRYYEVKRDVTTLSYDQVRRPIYQSAVKRWMKYEQFLGPLKEALRDEAV